MSSCALALPRRPEVEPRPTRLVAVVRSGETLEVEHTFHREIHGHGSERGRVGRCHTLALDRPCRGFFFRVARHGRMGKGFLRAPQSGTSNRKLDTNRQLKVGPKNHLACGRRRGHACSTRKYGYFSALHSSAMALQLSTTRFSSSPEELPPQNLRIPQGILSARLCAPLHRARFVVLFDVVLFN